jgi:hypothetical protein
MSVTSTMLSEAVARIVATPRSTAQGDGSGPIASRPTGLERTVARIELEEGDVRASAPGAGSSHRPR